MQPAVELPLIKIPHVVITKHLPSLFSLDTQSTHPKNIPFDIAGQPPSPQITGPARYNSRSADAKRRLVAVVCPLFLEELRTDDATDLTNARLEGQCESSPGCPSQGGRSPCQSLVSSGLWEVSKQLTRPKRHKIRAVEHVLVHVRHCQMFRTVWENLRRRCKPYKSQSGR